MTRAIAERLAEVRTSHAGERGRARFAAELGLTPSTYGNYEKGRVPPPQLLVRVADLTGVDLVWLLTGRSAGRPPDAAAPAAGGDPRQRAILERAADLLSRRPNSLPAFAAFVDLLEAKARVEAGGPQLPPAERAPADAARSPAGPRGRSASAPDFGRWVPIFGRAAAGLARFWDELRPGLTGAAESLPGPSALDRMIHQAAMASDADSRLAVLEQLGGAGAAASAARSRPAAGSARSAAQPRQVRVRLIQLAEPITDFQLTEFLDAPTMADRFRPLFGLRLDGDSMEPLFADGTIVLCSPGEPARPGAPAVVRLAGQIGVACKLYRPRGELVRLVSANDKYEPQEFPARQIDWALAVLGSVRL